MRKLPLLKCRESRVESRGPERATRPSASQLSTLNSQARRGFTLVELLVAITIILVLSVITLITIRVTTKDDKINGAARQLQSYLEGARDRAIHAGAPRGVRFVLDPNVSNTVTSVVYVGPPEKYTDGQIRILADKRSIDFSGSADWANLRARDLLPDGSRLLVTAGSNLFFTVAQEGGTWKLTKDYPTAGPTAFMDYELDLAPAVLPNQEPKVLPQGVVLDFTDNADHSKLPTQWGSPGSYSQMDVMFSPRGTVIGPTASAGMIHLLITDIKDLTNKLGPGDDKESAETLVTIVTQTGNISVHSVFSSADPFRYAETGVESNK